MNILFSLCFLLCCTFSAHATTWVHIPAGSFQMGSSPQQLQQAYRISLQGYGHDGVRQAHWFDHEAPQRTAQTRAFDIMRTPVTQAEYAVFIQETGYAVPFVSAQQWNSYHLAHPYSHVRPYLWHEQQVPQGKRKHPVVLVNGHDAQAYAQWLSRKTGQHIQLPSAKEWEKAMRGNQAWLYPWGNSYHPDYLNNADQGTSGTMPVGSFPQGASPYGVLDAAGQVFEWTRDVQGSYATVKGGSWDDHGGICRPAAYHQRPITLKHILIGFRLMKY